MKFTEAKSYGTQSVLKAGSCTKVVLKSCHLNTHHYSPWAGTHPERPGPFVISSQRLPELQRLRETDSGLGDWQKNIIDEQEKKLCFTTNSGASTFHGNLEWREVGMSCSHIRTTDLGSMHSENSDACIVRLQWIELGVGKNSRLRATCLDSPSIFLHLLFNSDILSTVIWQTWYKVTWDLKDY